MNDLQIKPTTIEDTDWINSQIDKLWGADFIVSQNKLYYPAKLDGYIASTDQTKLGLLTYEIREDEIEIVSLHSISENIGVGTALIQEIVKSAEDLGLKQIKAITTNDNLKALAVYQKTGFALKAIYSGAVDISRKYKEIPRIAENGIPIRDEIELVYLVK